MKITEDVFINIIQSFPVAPPEHGGIIGGKNGIVSEFCYDNAGPNEEAVYETNASYLNTVIEKWRENGVLFYGIIHSHMNNELELSNGDVEYINLLMSGLDIDEKLYFPIAVADNIIPFVAIKTRGSVQIEKEELEVLFR